MRNLNKIRLFTVIFTLPILIGVYFFLWWQFVYPVQARNVCIGDSDIFYNNLVSRYRLNFIPAGEAGAGENVSIILLSEYLAHARQGSDTAPVQVWNRCPPGVAESRPALAVEKSG